MSGSISGRLLGCSNKENRLRGWDGVVAKIVWEVGEDSCESPHAKQCLGRVGADPKTSLLA